MVSQPFPLKGSPTKLGSGVAARQFGPGATLLVDNRKRRPRQIEKGTRVIESP